MSFSLRLFGKEVFGIERRASSGFMTQHLREALAEIRGTATSTPVNEGTAMKLTALYRAVNLIAETISSLPFNVYQLQGSRRILTRDHPVYRLIERRPSPLMNSMQFKYSMMVIALLRGASYARIIRNQLARPVELQIFANPYDVTPFIFENALYFQIKGEELPVPSGDMFRILWTSFDGITPVSPIRAAAVALSRGLSSQAYAERIFSEGGTRKVAITSLGKVDENAKKNLRDSWLNVHGGIDNIHKPAILEGGIDIKEIGIKPEEAQLLQTQEFTVQEIARLYGVPLHMLASSKTQGYNSNEQLNIEFNTYTMYPWYVRWETEMMDKFFYEKEKDRLEIKIDNTALLRGDSKSRTDYYLSLFRASAVSPNEIRRMEGKNPVEDPAMDDYFIQKQYIPLRKAGMDENNSNGKTND